MPDQRNPQAALRRCHDCGDAVPTLDHDGLCPVCAEVDARVAAHIGAAMEEFAHHTIGVSLDYLHEDDVRAVVERCVADREDTWVPIPRLRTLFARSARYIDARAERATQSRS